jgi:hypothetical protein
MESKFVAHLRNDIRAPKISLERLDIGEKIGVRAVGETFQSTPIRLTCGTASVNISVR